MKLSKKLDIASRKLTQILRHQIVHYNLDMNSKGFVKLDDILKLNLKELKNITQEDVNIIVNNNDKKRLELENINDDIYIRVVQGHNNEVGSLIDDDVSLEKIDINTNITHIYHGTQSKYVDLILKNGLNKMNRKHMHFVEHFDKEKQTSGFKNVSDNIIVVNIKKCIEDGIEFYKSSNNVILTEGIDGIIPSKYIVDIIEI